MYYIHVSLYTHLLSFTSFFFFNDTPTTEIYTLSLHDALPICEAQVLYGSIVGNVKDQSGASVPGATVMITRRDTNESRDRKSTRLNSSHSQISYAVFCLKKKKKKIKIKIKNEQKERTVIIITG